MLLRLGKQPAVRRKGFYSQRLEGMRGEVSEVEGDDDISTGGMGSRDDMGIGLVDQLRQSKRASRPDLVPCLGTGQPQQVEETVNLRRAKVRTLPQQCRPYLGENLVRPPAMT